jgi:hypothetical protein
MQRSIQAVSFRELDDLAISALLPHQPKVTRISDSYATIEVVDIQLDSELDIEEIAVTHQFSRLSAPYERIDLDLSPSALAPVRSRPTRFARTTTRPPTAAETVRTSADAIRAAEAAACETIRTTVEVAASAAVRTAVEVAASATMSLDQKWFAQPEDAITDEPVVVPNVFVAWRWLAISLAVATFAIAFALSV